MLQVQFKAHDIGDRVASNLEAATYVQGVAKAANISTVYMGAPGP